MLVLQLHLVQLLVRFALHCAVTKSRQLAMAQPNNVDATAVEAPQVTEAPKDATAEAPAGMPRFMGGKG